jgi:hypothetical protein
MEAEAFEIEKTTREKVEIPVRQIDARIIRRLHALFNFNTNGWYEIRDDYLCHCYEEYTSHSFTVRDKIRKATPADRDFVSMIFTIQDRLREKYVQNRP